MILIAVATLAAILETEPVWADRHRWPLRLLEAVLGLIFLLEYAARLWAAAEQPERREWKGRLYFLLSPAAMLDLFVVAGTLLPALGLPLMPLRLVRLLRILSLAKLGRTSSALRHIVTAVASRREELVLTAGFAGVLLVFGATSLYMLEGQTQPDQFGSIPRALWWSVVTMTTIGYGDVYPVTPLGRLAASVVAFGGIGLIALPTGILAAAFSESYRQEKHSSDDAP